MKEWQTGLVQVYTGNGKGKTTAAFGLALRAVGAGLNVFIGQFVKGMKYSEINAFELLQDKIAVKQYGRRCFIHGDPEAEDIEMARQGLQDSLKQMLSGNYDVVILDEANIATYYKLFSAKELLAVIDQKPEDVELIITGRYAEPEILERADLITEMKEVKHYYAKGIEARKGIES